MTTLHEAATQLSDAFETRTRANGEVFKCLKDGSPEWIEEAVQSAHGDMMPNDWSYRLISHIASSIDEYASDNDIDELRDLDSEIIDRAIPVYTRDQLDWLSSNLERLGYCDQAREDGLVAEDSDMDARIVAGIYLECSEIFATLLDALEAQVTED